MFKFIKMVILLVIIAGLGILLLPLGSVDYKDTEMKSTLRVPSFAMFEKECCAYTATFKSVRSEWALKREFEKLKEEYYVAKTCSDGRRVYVDEKNQVVVESYSVLAGFPFNTFSITYHLGTDC